MRLLLRLLSVLGTISYGAFALLIMSMMGMSAGVSGSMSRDATGACLFFFPFAYLGFCFITSFKSIRGKGLLAAGVVAHLLLLPWIIAMFVNGQVLMGSVGAFLALVWVGMYMDREEQQPR